MKHVNSAIGGHSSNKTNTGRPAALADLASASQSNPFIQCLIARTASRRRLHAFASARRE
ncbi:hypothetical protein SBA3_1270005 [Candidatus Sulfopaludibacter sp. SbA3]|nr:hypothetical protein SBA3_1270005 [Candidatus Sulfopaludibacter sp. SbA3]